jgi:two-component system chemotaxis response regulator CheY
MKLNILCIDDSRSVHAFLKQCLGINIKNFYSVFDGSLALDFFRQNPEKQIDIIFLDWEMPKMTGPETFRELKKLKVNTKIIMLTSKNDPKNIIEMLEAGVAEYIMKPFTSEIILEKLQAILPS